MFRNVNTREVVAELTTEGSMFLAARGGAGGKGNAYFKSSEKQAPMLAEVGGEGEEYIFDIGKWVNLKFYQYLALSNQFN